MIEDEINRMLDRFGNPVGGASRPGAPANEAASLALKSAIEEAGCVHFLSMSVIPGLTAGEKSYLVLEASVDGSASSALARICASKVPAVLLPVFSAACGARTPDDVKAKLKKCRVRDITHRLPEINLTRRTATGLFFTGVKGQTISQIEANRDVQTIARAAVDELVADDRRDFTTNPSEKLAAITSLFLDEPVGPQAAALKSKLQQNSEVSHLMDGDRYAVLSAHVREEFARRARLPVGDIKLPFADPPVGQAESLAEDRSFAEQAIRLLGLFSRPILMTAGLVFLAILCLHAFQSSFYESLGRVFGDVSAQNDAGREIIKDQTVWPFLRLISNSLAITAVSTVLVLSLLAGIIVRALHRAEALNAQKAFLGAPDIETVRQMMLRENRTPAQNHMISITRIQKAGWLGSLLRKHLFLPVAFRAIARAASAKWFRDGFLADIGTIHFARWVVMPGTRNLAFFSNYNSNWESYLEDFITKAPQGLTGIWGNTDGFPKTSNLFEEGATNGDAFKRFARASMIPTRLWYARYPDLSVNQIRRNAVVLSGLGTDVNRSHAEAWLSLFDSDQRPVNKIEFEDVQSIVFSGCPRLKHAACQVVKFPDGLQQERLKAWAADMTARITTGKKVPGDKACFIAFSHEGLVRLGVKPAQELHTSPNQPVSGSPDRSGGSFAPAFQLGMDHISRTNVLSDTGANGPENWLWGSDLANSGRVHAVVLLYWSLGNFPSEIRETLDQFGLEAGPLINMQAMPDDGPLREPFGWADGISQPRLRGVSASPLEDPLNTVEPGEVLLGYRDNRGYFPPTALVSKANDPANLLPLPPNDLPGAYPDFTCRSEWRDFGRNGSYLVIRQLEQYADKFDRWREEEAEKLNKAVAGLPKSIRERFVPADSEIDRDYIGAKVFGRWPDGEPLVRYPTNPRRETDQQHRAPSAQSEPFRKHALNAFRYSDEDPQGFNCPFGAHIRRANPRDSLNPDNPNSIAIANRHRILRRGRTFVEPASSGEAGREGTFFMCLNADIERQFEFIQQNWLNSAAFHDLNDEIDVIAGQTSAPDAFRRFSLQGAGGPSLVSGWDSFVRMLGGGYFFLPGRRAMQYLANSYTPADPISS